MKPWELSDEKLDDILRDWVRRTTSKQAEPFAEAVATEAQKKLVRWQEERCVEHREGLSIRRWCYECGKALREWTEGGE